MSTSVLGNLRYLRFLLLCLLSLASLAWPLSSLAAHVERQPRQRPVVVSLRVLSHQDKNLELQANFEVEPGWHVYSNVAGDTGFPLSVQLDQKNSKNISKIKEIVYPASEAKHERIAGEKFTTFVYEQPFHLLIALEKISADQGADIALVIKYGVCRESCMLFEENLVLKAEPFPVFMHNSPSSNSSDYDKAAEEGEGYICSRVTAQQFVLLLLGALCGGMILNFMPCVLPILSLKLFSVIKYSNLDSRKAALHLFYTALGIIATFIIMGGITIILKLSGQAFGWGLHFQSTKFLMFMVIVLVVVSSNLWGDFALELPSVINDKLSRIGLEASYIGSFLSGVVTTILATPCTAPFLTTAVAYALTQSEAVIVATYLAAGLGMSSPYLILAIRPQALQRLPKGGRWMEPVKKTIAALILLAAIWIILTLSYHLSHLSLAILVLGLCLLRVVIVKSRRMAVSSRLLLIILVLGMVFVLPLIYNNKHKIQVDSVSADWVPFDNKTLEKYIEEDRLVLVDITASWCVTCKMNKLAVLESESIINELIRHKVVLMRADYTRHNLEIDQFLKKYGHHGIPFNIIYGPSRKEGIILPTLLTSAAVTDAIQQAGKFNDGY